MYPEAFVDYLRVLVIDDSVTIRAMIEQIINKEPGCHVVGIAPDVITARRMLIELAPNVVTLDLSMPGIDGFAFLNELRDTLHAPVVVVSTSTRLGSEETARALAHGADACFDKAKIITEASRLITILKRASKRKIAGKPAVLKAPAA